MDGGRDPSATKYHIGYREAKAHACIVACIGWIFVVSVAALGTGERSVFGPLKWSDFVHFYTMGQIANSGPASLLYDGYAQHLRQVQLVPESAADGFLPFYAPQTALLFAPFSRLPYVFAGGLWAAITMVVYAWAVWLAWRPARDILSDRLFLCAAALAFPPVWQLAMYGQTTAVPLFAFTAAWLAVERGHRFLAGLALGLLAVKPQFGLVVAVVAIVAAEWQIIGGVLISVTLQSAAALGWFGAGIFSDYARTLRRLPASTALLEPDAYKMHSIAALTGLLPKPADVITWAVVSLVIIVMTCRIWKHFITEPRVRFGVLVLASVLVSPHTVIYDVTLLALPILWLGGWLLEQQNDSTWFWQRVYWLAVALFLPFALLVKVQFSVIIMAELFARVAVYCTRPFPPAPGDGVATASNAVGCE
jgi:hypothetical protein